MYFEIVGEISEIEKIARGPSLRERTRLRKQFGPGKWRKLKGVATVRLANRRVRKVELHGMKRMGLERRS